MYPPSLKFCHIRQCWILSVPRAWRRETCAPCDCPILPEYAEQLARQILAGPPPPEVDDEGQVHPAKADQMPRIAPLVLESEEDSWDDEVQWVPVAMVPEKVAGRHTAGSGV